MSILSKKKLATSFHPFYSISASVDSSGGDIESFSTILNNAVVMDVLCRAGRISMKFVAEHVKLPIDNNMNRTTSLHTGRQPNVM